MQARARKQTASLLQQPYVAVRLQLDTWHAGLGCGTAGKHLGHSGYNTENLSHALLDEPGSDEQGPAQPTGDPQPSLLHQHKP